MTMTWAFCKHIKAPRTQNANTIMAHVGVIMDREDEMMLDNYAICRTDNGYAKVYAHGKQYYLHRFLLEAPRHMQVDHINGDGLDNRRTNLRLVTPSQNQWNRGKKQSSRTGYKGVTRGSNGRFLARIMHQNKQTHLGTFKTVEAASFAYVTAESRLRMSYVRT